MSTEGVVLMSSARMLLKAVVATAAASAFAFATAPLATADTSSGDQWVSVSVSAAGVLNISADGSIASSPYQGGTTRIDVGPIYYTNTILDSADWYSTVVLTQFGGEDGSATMGYDNFTYDPGDEFISNTNPGSWVEASAGDPYPFTGSDPAVSDPLTVAFFNYSEHGSYVQQGGVLEGTIPFDQQPMEYGATLTYTVMAEPAI